MPEQRPHFRNKPAGQLISDRAIREEMNAAEVEYRQLLRAMERQCNHAEFPAEAETARLTEEAVRALDLFITDHIDPLIDRPGAEYLKEATRKRRKDFGLFEVRGKEILEGAMRFLRRHMYWGPCPQCEGSKCGECRGKGWVTVGMYAKIRGSKHD